MLDARFRPLPKWTRKPGLEYRRSQFKTQYNKTLDLLEYELGKLNAKNVIIEAGFRLNQIRNDGWPYGGQKPEHPGVVLYFKNGEGDMQFPCGTYQKFENNIYAIALTLENLRAIDRYGVTLGHEQYRGFMALPVAPKEWSVEQAADFIASHVAEFPAPIVIKNPESYRKAYRAAAAKLYPHTPAGNEGWHQLSQARTILDKHHGIKQEQV